MPPTPKTTDSTVPLFIAEVEQFGGAERSFVALARWLHEHGRQVELVTYADHCNLQQYATTPLHVRVLAPQGGGVRSKVAVLREYLRARGPDAKPVLASGYQPALHLTLAGRGRFHCLMHDTPALFGDGPERSLKAKIRIALSNRIISYGLRRGGVTLVNSEFLRESCWQDFHVRAVIARMGGLGEPHAFQRRPLADELRLLSVCRIEPNKRIDWLLDALGAMEKDATPLSAVVNWRLDLAGKGSLLAAMRERAAALGIADRVTFHGFVPDDVLETMYARAHAFLMPAVQGYGIPAVEALQRGIPVLLHRDSGVSDILLQTPWAVVMDGGKDTMRPALEELLTRLRNGVLLSEPPPALPTEDGWAEEVATLCGYV